MSTLVRVARITSMTTTTPPAIAPMRTPDELESGIAAFVSVADGPGVLSCGTDTGAEVGVGVEVRGSWEVEFVTQVEPSRNVSEGHAQAWMETAPGLAVALGGQGVQLALPVVSLYVFAAHASHVPWNPVVPVGQGFG